MSDTTFVLADVGRRRVAVEVGGIEKILPLAELSTRRDMAPSQLGFLDVAGELLPVFDAGGLLGAGPLALSLDSLLLVLVHDGRRCILAVDTVADIAVLELARANDDGRENRWVRSKDGPLTPVLDVGALLSRLLDEPGGGAEVAS